MAKLIDNNIQQDHHATSHFSGNSLDIDNTPSWLSKATFTRNQSDLIATSPSGEQINFIDYFTNYELP